ncbi:hypothetical protein LTR50_004910 [Elasticomyces elasticus]|nr:hypothetical protein LTR50_004910 [Elasticomyces elasticus]
MRFCPSFLSVFLSLLPVLAAFPLLRADVLSNFEKPRILLYGITPFFHCLRVTLNDDLSLAVSPHLSGNGTSSLLVPGVVADHILDLSWIFSQPTLRPSNLRDTDVGQLSELTVYVERVDHLPVPQRVGFAIRYLASVRPRLVRLTSLPDGHDALFNGIGSDRDATALTVETLESHPVKEVIELQSGELSDPDDKLKELRTLEEEADAILKLIEQKQVAVSRHAKQSCQYFTADLTRCRGLSCIVDVVLQKTRVVARLVRIKMMSPHHGYHKLEACDPSPERHHALTKNFDLIDLGDKAGHEGLDKPMPGSSPPPDCRDKKRTRGHLIHPLPFENRSVQCHVPTPTASSGSGELSTPGRPWRRLGSAGYQAIAMLEEPHLTSNLEQTHIVKSEHHVSPLIEALVIVAGALGLTALFAFLHRRFSSLRKRVERLADQEERRTARQYKRAAQREAFRQLCRRLFRRRQEEPHSDDYEEKRAFILATNQAYLSSLQSDMVEAEFRELRAAHEIVASIVRADSVAQAEEGRFLPEHPAYGVLPTLSEHVCRVPRPLSRSNSLPSYTSDPAPTYTFSAESGQGRVADGLRVHSQSVSSNSRRYTPDSSVIAMSPRPSAETIRTTRTGSYFDMM